MIPVFFENPAELRDWLHENSKNEDELWVGIYKKQSGRQRITWVEAVDEALCFGWTESKIKKIDTYSYAVRLTPRIKGSAWSKKNIEKATLLMEMGLLEELGKQVFLSRDSSKDYDQNSEFVLNPGYISLFKQDTRAWEYFQQSSPAYKRNASRWIMSAKKEETRQRRLQSLISSSANGKKAPPF